MSEREALGNKINKLPPLPNLSEFSNDRFKDHPLLKFRLQEAKRKQVVEELYQRARNAKIRCASKKKPPKSTSVFKKSANPLVELLRHAEKRPKPGLPDCIWLYIMSFVPEKLRKAWHELVALLQTEIRAQFTEDLHNLTIMEVLIWKPSVVHSVDFLNIAFPPGRSENYNQFLQVRSKLENILMITHPFARFVLSTSEQMLPDTLVMSSAERRFGYLSVQQAVEARLMQITQGSQKICQWIVVLENELLSKYRQPVRKSLLKTFCNCVNYLIAEKIHQCIRRTVTSLTMSAETKEASLMLSMSVVHEHGNFRMDPPLEEICKASIDYAKALCAVGDGLPSVEKMLQLNDGRTLLPSRIWEKDYETTYEVMYIKRSQFYFEPVSIYIAKVLEPLFGDVCSKETEEAIEKLVRGNYSYEEYRTRIEYFSKFLEEKEKLPAYEFFEGISLHLLPVQTFMKGKVDQIISKLAQKMCHKHQAEIEKLSREFQTVARRASKYPSNTRELMDLSRYLLYATNQLLPNLRDRVQDMLKRAWEIEEFTELKEAHREFITSGVRWLLSIGTILQDAGVRIEQQKFDQEERLYDTSLSVKKAVHELFPKLSKLYYMDSAHHVPNYVLDVRRFLGKVKRIEETIAWVHVEEFLLGRQATNFLELEELKNLIVPFAKLVFLVNDWQRSKKMWLLSIPEELNFSAIIDKINYFQREIVETLKVFGQKIKAQTDMNYEHRFPGVVDDPEVRNRPAPIKLCLTAQMQIEEFKRQLPLIKLLGNPALTPDHWQEMSQIAGRELTPNAGSTLQKYMTFNLSEKLEELEIVASSANLEADVEDYASQILIELEDMSAELPVFPEATPEEAEAEEECRGSVDEHSVGSEHSEGNEEAEQSPKRTAAKANKSTRRRTVDRRLSVRVKRFRMIESTTDF